jgi:hypothetical protein
VSSRMNFFGGCSTSEGLAPWGRGGTAHTWVVPLLAEDEDGINFLKKNAAEAPAEGSK